MKDHRILHVITGLITGGAELSLLRLLEASPELRVGARVISLRDLGTVGPRLGAIGVPVSAVGIRGRFPTPGELARYRHMVLAASPTLVQGWMYHGNLAALAARVVQSRCVSVAWNIRHSVYSLRNEKPLTGVVIRIGASLSHRPDRIIYNARCARLQHEALGYSPDRAQVIPNGFDTDRYAPSAGARAAVRGELGVEQSTPVVGLVARYHPIKGHGVFLRAVALVQRRFPAARFVMAGTDVTRDNRALMTLAGELGVESVILPVGEIANTARLMSALDLLCLASSSEGFPNVVGEAMACEVPCVVTDVGDAAWLLDGAGVVVPANDPEALAEGIMSLLLAPKSARTEAGRLGRRRIVEHFALPAIARQYIDLYSELMAPQAC